MSAISKLSKVMRGYLLGLLVFGLYNLLRLTWRVTYHIPDEVAALLETRKSFIFAHWHGDEVPLLVIGRKFRLATMSSVSSDGQMMAFVLKLMGVKTSRGSSSNRSVAGLLGLIKLVKSGLNGSFAVDGPKGPIYEVKSGVFELSRSLQIPIVAGSASCDKAWHFPKSWNKAFLPKPFAHIHITFSQPIPPITKEQNPRSEEYKDNLKLRLNEAKQQAGKFVAVGRG